MLTNELTEQEKKQLIECIDIAIRQAPSTLIAASQLLPLAAKLQHATLQQSPNPDSQS